jgi:hypothetical protein
VVPASGCELSLAWKLRWLAADQLTAGRSAGKDVYDAALLASSPGLHVSAALRHGVESFRAVPAWTVDAGGLPGDPADWLARLADRLRELT